MKKYQLTRDAQADLVSIRQFTRKRWGATQAQKYLTDLRMSVKRLAENPDLGVLSPDIGDGVLRFPCNRHVIYYFYEGGELIVFGVLHKGMVPLKHLDERL